jgi:hypothetical protein
MNVKNSLKKDGKVTITIEMEFNRKDISNHDIKESELDKIQKCIEYRLDGWVNMFWDDLDGYIEEELETIRQK